MCVRIFHLQIIHAEKIAQFNGSFHPGVKVPLSFTNGNLWRWQQEVAGGKAPYQVAHRQLAKKKKNTPTLDT